MKKYTLILVVITLTLAGFFLSWYVGRDYQNFVKNQQELMQQSTTGAARLINLYLKDARRSVQLFTQEQSELIGSLAHDPADEDGQTRLSEMVRRHFPDYFAYTITDAKGDVLLDDYDGKLAELCQDDIHHFLEGDEQPVFIHPNPIGYHFDIMADWKTPLGHTGIFFISFKPEVLSGILGNSQLHDHQLILLHRERPGLIEVTAEGTRVELKRDLTLTEEEMRRIGYTADVPGTLWTLADLPNAGLFSSSQNTLRVQAITIFLIFLVFSSIMYRFIVREEFRRTQAERAVLESRNQLERRVTERTQELSETNTRLESEVREHERAKQALKREMTERQQTEDTLRALHEITSSPDLDFPDKLNALLENGCRQFRLPLGILSHVYGETYEVVQVVSPDGSITPGTRLDLGKTYCRETLKAKGPVGFEHAERSQWRTHPCYREFRLETYFGIPVTVGNDVYGTLNFSSLEPRDSPFTATDMEILRLMAQWVGSEIYRQQTEQALTKERNNAQRYLDLAGVIFLVIDTDQRVSLINRKGCQTLGYREEEIIGRNWFDCFIPAQSRESVRALFEDLVGGSSRITEYHQNTVLTRSGEQRLIAWHNTVLYSDDGVITATLSSGEDITVQKQAEEQLRQREEQLRLTLENAPIGIVTADLDGNLFSVNPTLCTILGYTAAELLRMTVQDITHPDDWRETQAQFTSLVKGTIARYELTKRYIRRDGSVITGHVRAGLVRDADDKPLMIVGELEDITEHERAEKMFRMVVESAPNAIVMVNKVGEIVLVNSQTESYFGYRRDELLGKPIETLIPERLRGQHPLFRKSFMREGRARSMGLGRSLFGLRKDRSEFPVEIGLSPVETDRGTLVLAAIVDISERVHSDQQIQRMRAYLKNIIDSMPSILVGVDNDGRVTEWNQGAEQATGVGMDRAIGRRFRELFPELESQLENMNEAIRTHTPVHTERLITEKNGETHYADVMVYPLLENGAAGAVIRVDDITDRVRIEQMMVQTEKMLSVGGLAAGMAHEINNPLSGVLQSCQNIQRRLSSNLEPNRVTAQKLGLDLDLVHRYLDERGIPEFVTTIQQAASRASRIVADMLAFSRSTTTEFQPARMEEILETVVRLAASDYDLKKKYDFKQIEILRDYDPELGWVNCDHTEIEQVFLNLVKNAAQAMAHSDTPPPHRITLRTRNEGAYARIEVQDNGPGMDEKVRRRVFEPFFTTKAVGVGTGLGLSVSYFIVTEQHKGTINVVSSPGEGTCFIVRLPVQGRATA